LAVGIQLVALPQIIQDKICLQLFNDTNKEFCHYLSAAEDSRLKDQVLANYSVLFTYKEYIVLIPGTISVLFIGSWCDKFLSGKKFCLIGSCISQMIEVGLFLLSALYMDVSVYVIFASYFPMALFGQGFGFWTVLFSFIAKHIPSEEKAIRFISVNLFTTIGMFVSIVIQFNCIFY